MRRPQRRRRAPGRRTAARCPAPPPTGRLGRSGGGRGSRRRARRCPRSRGRKGERRSPDARPGAARPRRGRHPKALWRRLAAGRRPPLDAPDALGPGLLDVSEAAATAAAAAAEAAQLLRPGSASPAAVAAAAAVLSSSVFTNAAGSPRFPGSAGLGLPPAPAAAAASSSGALAAAAARPSPQRVASMAALVKSAPGGRPRTGDRLSSMDGAVSAAAAASATAAAAAVAAVASAAAAAAKTKKSE